MRIVPFGAAREVTGSAHLLLAGGRRVLLDCGMFQGKEEARNHAPFGFDPKEVDAVLLTHAHLDHVGRLPKLFREGYRGPVYATRATVLLMEIVLEDALKVMDEPFFGPEDVEEALGHLRPLEYGEWLRLGALSLAFGQAGHLPGSAFVVAQGEGRTLVYSGEVAHADSAGNQGIVGPGEVQWMHAASGVLHKEYQSEAFTASGGVFHMAQLWVNLPAQRKMVPPSYCSIHREQIQVVPIAGGALELVAGRLGQNADGSWSCLSDQDVVLENSFQRMVSGAAPVCSPIWLFHWNQGDSHDQILELRVPGGATVLALVVEGSLGGELEGVGNGHLVVFKRSLTDESSSIRVEALAGTKVLWMIGQPLNEPIAAYGPFVMNSKDQIQQAFEDYQNGRFGILN